MARILIVEDEPSVREMTCFTLKQSGYECLEAESAEDARESLKNGDPTLILMDWMLPGVSGIELTKELKENPSTRTIPIIMLTPPPVYEDAWKQFRDIEKSDRENSVTRQYGLAAKAVASRHE